MADYGLIESVSSAIDLCRAELGDKYFLDELLSALDYDELRSCIEWIARMNDIELEYGL